MSKTIISTPNAPAAIGSYSQAVKVGDTVYLSGQIGLDPATMQMVEGVDAQIARVFDNLKAVVEASGGSLSDIVKLNVYLTDLVNFPRSISPWRSAFPNPSRRVRPSAWPSCRVGRWSKSTV